MAGDRQRRIVESQEVLRALGFDNARSNERSALVLLALLGIQPSDPWSAATDETYRVVDIMESIRTGYDKDYAPNSRETIRRQTLHQFVDAGFVLYNPDDPARPVNSGNNCYQIAPEALRLLRSRDERGFEERAEAYVSAMPGLAAAYAKARELSQLPIKLLDGSRVTLSPGGQNILLKAMLEQFCPRWTPDGVVLYIGDAGKEDPVFEEARLGELGVRLDKHGKLPDLVVHLPTRDWLVLMEAASSHGPVDAKRHYELETLFSSSSAGPVYVSCFPSRAEMRRYLVEIAWETEVWCADDPDHLIHFDGEQFLGPYPAPGSIDEP